MQWENLFGGSIWAVVIVLGPIIFALVLLYAILNNRQTRAQKQRSEEAARELREEIARDDERGAA